jgi:hypothetical protein
MLSEFPRSGRTFDLLLHFRSVRPASAGFWNTVASRGLKLVAPAAAPQFEAAPATEAAVEAGGADEALWWGRERLRSSDTDGGACPEVIDVTGPRRCLVFGPHLPLEPGRWRATAMFEVCPDASRRQLSVQFGCYPDFTTVQVPVGVSGLHQIELEYEFKPDQLAEVRLLLDRAGFHGELRFSGAALQKVGDV